MIGLAACAAGAVYTLKYFATDPMEYDLTRVQSEQTERGRRWGGT